MKKKEYERPEAFITVLNSEVLLGTSVFDGDHITKPQDNWTNTLANPNDVWSGWF